MRIDLELIGNWVEPGSRVLDLGCGDGALLKQLCGTHKICGYGIENDPEQIQLSIENGVNVIEKNLDKELDGFADQSFDTVVMTFTLQVMKHPDLMLEEMLRVGRECIVTFPNFGSVQSRLSLLWHGRMPVTHKLPYQWYDTPNIHFCTINDFETLCREKGYRVLNRQILTENTLNRLLVSPLPNLFGQTAVYHLSAGA